MTPEEDGAFVRSADYDSLRAQLEAAEARHARDVSGLLIAEKQDREPTARAEAAEADAARYEWLRDWKNYPDHDWWSNELSRTTVPKDFDAAIARTKEETK